MSFINQDLHAMLHEYLENNKIKTLPDLASAPAHV